MIATLLHGLGVQRWPVPIVLVLSAACSAYCRTSAAAAAASSEYVGRRPLRIDLGQMVPAERDVVKLFFSADGQMVCAWWHDWRVVRTNYGSVRRTDQFRVFDLAGKQLCSSQDADRTLLWTNFPLVAWRDTQTAFITNAVGWLFDPAHAWAVRVLDLPTFWGVRIECWSLPYVSNADPVWSREMDRVFSCRPVGKVDPAGDELLFALQHARALILSRRTGETIREFTLGRAETEEELAKRKLRFGLHFAEGDPALSFSPRAFSYDERKHLLACGASFDKRVRVVDITAPVRVVFEANSDANPAKPRGGTWKVSRVEFVASGKYLIAGYDFGGRLTTVSIDSTEILDTETWRTAWKEEDPKIGSVTLSPDGSLLAFVRDKGIEFIPFRPEK